MYKMFNLFSWVTDLVETFTFYGGGKGGESSSTSTPVDFFGKDGRKPYADLLSQLLLGGGTIGGTSGSGGRATNLPPGVIDAGGGKYYQIKPPRPGIWGMGPAGAFSSSTATLVPWRAPTDYQPTTKPDTPGMSVTDYIKSTPGYQFGMDQGRQALERSFSSRGFGQTGNESIALSGYGQQYAGQQYQQLINNLLAPSGASLIGNQTTSTSSGPSGLGGFLGTVAGAVLPAMGNPFAIAGPATMGATVSDKNLKTNIKHIDTINGIKIYSFNYIWSYIKSIGVMAQDLLKMPQYKDAVHMTSIGYAVDYSKLPI